MEEQPTTIRPNTTMSFEENVESPVLSAAHALLSLGPSPSSVQDKIPTRVYTVVGSSHSMVPSPSCISSYEHQSPKSVVHTHPPQILNLPSSVPSSGTGTVSSCDSSLDGSLHADWTTDESTRFYEGSVSLSLKEDEESLSPLHCFMRKFCVEAFTATAKDVSTPRYGKSHGRSIVVGQVGIQCMHCKHRPYVMRQERSVCFPSSLKNIYHSIETWQRRHSLVCGDIPPGAKIVMTELMGKSRSGAGGRRQYWEESAIRLGMVDTQTGIHFIHPPGHVMPVEEVTPCDIPIVDQPPSLPLVCMGDQELVTDFLFVLLDQMETCYFSEQDRVGGRSKVKDCPIGYPGLQCKHCGGKAGFGRYFPVSIQALTSANSDRNIFNHIDKCRRCPVDVKHELSRYLQEQQSSKNRRGNRKIFFQRVWERMHGPQVNSYL